MYPSAKSTQPGHPSVGRYNEYQKKMAVNRLQDTLSPYSYLQKLITVQPPHSTSSSSLVTLAHPSKSSSLWITDRSFQYASSRLWNQLPTSLHQPHTNLSDSASPSSLSDTSFISSINSPLLSSITPSLFHSRLKTFLFWKSFPPQPSFSSSGLTQRTDYRHFWAYPFCTF